MYALDLRKNEAIQTAFKPITNEELVDCECLREWQTRHRHRRLYVEEPVAKRLTRTRIRHRLAWDRVLLAFIVLASVATFRANAGLDAQYQHDLKTTYK